MPKTTAPAAEPGALPEDAQPTPVELVSDTSSMFVNAGQVELVLLQPAMVLKPGHLIELECDPGHRDLRRATPAEIKAARAAAASSTPTPGQEQ